MRACVRCIAIALWFVGGFAMTVQVVSAAPNLASAEHVSASSKQEDVRLMFDDSPQTCWVAAED